MSELIQLIKHCKTREELETLIGKKPYYIKIRETEHYWCLSYSSETSLIECQQARGIVLEKGTFRVIARGFDKFFNLEENFERKTFFDKQENVVVYEKIDGSLVKL